MLRGQENEMKSLPIRIGLVVVLVMLNCVAFAQTPTSVDSLVGAAKNAAGLEWAGTLLRLCIPPPPAAPAAAARGAAPGANATRPGNPARDAWYAEPAKVADNLYFLGTKIHNAWAIVGSEGIIILEALFDYAAQDEIIGGMKKLGLDTGKIKYVILSHAHADHDGGAKLLQDEIPGVHLVYGAEDWDAVDRSTNHAGGKPKRDIAGTDGMKISVGDAAVQIVTMPGHTPGTTSVVVPVTDRGQRHIAFVLSGPRTETLETSRQMLTSEEKLAKVGKEKHVDVELTNHSYVDDSLPIIEAIRKRKPSDPNAYVIGEEGFQHFTGWQAECLRADIARSEK